MLHRPDSKELHKMCPSHLRVSHRTDSLQKQKIFEDTSPPRHFSVPQPPCRTSSSFVDLEHLRPQLLRGCSVWYRAVIQGEIRQPVHKVSPTKHLQPENRGTASARASRNEVELFWRSVIECGGDSRQIISLEPLRTRAERGVGVSGPLNQDNVYFPNSLEYS